MTAARRRWAEARGQRAESLAAWYLRAKGYAILARRYRTPAGELDLVARRGGAVAFVEVKTRDDLEQAKDAVTARQRQRILRAAEVYLQRHPSLGKLEFRFDVILIARRRWPKHIADAWRAPDRGRG